MGDLSKVTQRAGGRTGTHTRPPGPPQASHSQHLSPQGPYLTKLVRSYSILLLDRHWEAGTQEAGGAGAQVLKRWHSWSVGSHHGLAGMAVGVLLLLLLLLVHFVLLCLQILEADLHMTFSKPPLAASSEFPWLVM